MTITDLGGRILKVDHAGEHGAVNIYTGQIFVARLTAPDLVAELSEFLAHEKKHRAIFAVELERRGRRRCRSYVLCGLGGLALGLLTGLLGRSAIAATTVAVERVVLRHLEEQAVTLRGSDPAAVAAISAIIDDERQHHEGALRKLYADVPEFRLQVRLRRPRRTSSVGAGTRARRHDSRCR